MGVEERAREIIASALAGLAQEGALPREAPTASFAVERPKRPEHGDLATNAALAVQKLAKKPPREISALLAARLERASDVIASVEIAGPGFLNLRLQPAVFHEVLFDVTRAGKAFGRGAAATGERILLEFVSANPTGPLLISHGRGAILGDAIGRLLEAAGHRVTREYYVNDFGNQIRLLAASVRARIAGEPAPEGGYGGDYVSELAAWVTANAPAALADADTSTLARVCVTRVLDGVPGSRLLPGIKRTLREIGVLHDSWISEEGFHRWGKVDAALATLKACGYLEERDGALFFKSESEGDDKDRVVRKRDGATTYFASDIAYHADKIARGYDRLITILGADHHGYVARIRAVLRALDLPAERFEALLYQLVNLLRDGQPYKMGKRLGNLITIEEVVEEIDEASGRKGAGADALRYFYLSRRSETRIDLDLEIAKKANVDNPAVYFQYGYARLCSILRRGKDVCGIELPPRERAATLATKLAHPSELAILAQLGRFPALLHEAAALREPYRVVFFLQELSQEFQSYYTRLSRDRDPILPPESTMAQADWLARWDVDKSEARLLWIDAIRTVYAAGLELLGITALEKMERLVTDAPADEV